MGQALYVFGREVQDSLGVPYSQSAMVFAGSVQEAQGLLTGTLQSLTAGGIQGVEAVYQLGSGWNVEEIPLDHAKIVNIVTTKWPAG